MKALFKCLALAALFLAGSQLLAPATNAVPAKPNGVPSPVPLPPEKLSDGIIVSLLDGTFVRIQVFADNVIRVAAAKDRAFFARSTPATAGSTRRTSRPRSRSGMA